MIVSLGALALALVASGRARRSGESAVAGLGAPVDVSFDRFGIPSIHAGSAVDAAAALGWLHANDRLFQMELTRRAASGRLAEIFGARALRFDTRVRKLGFGRVTGELAAQVSPESRRWLEAYAAGVNAWLAERGADLPPEFRLLRHRPEPWRPEDSLAVIYVMARVLSPVMEPAEDESFAFLRAFGPERTRELIGELDAVVFDEAVELSRATPVSPEPLGKRAEGAGLGSNNWAVSAAKSATGGALLANDPHLDLELPSVWFEARIVAPDYEAVGMTLPGSPAVILGRGPRLAWACTNLYLDDVDVFLERLDAGGRNVLRGERWVAVESWRETVRVRNGEAIEIEVQRTDRGPLLAADPERGLPERSIAWTGWSPSDSLAAFVALARAGSVDEVRAAIAPYAFPAQNLVVADAAGSILWTPLGRAPDRFGWDGWLPAPGWRADVGWRGLLPAAANPELRDPAAGQIVTANSFLPVEKPAWFEGDFDTPFRMDRIRERLAARSDWTPREFLGLQRDVVSLWARRLVAALGDVSEGDAGRAAAALGAWDGAMSERGPAALFALVERTLQRAIFEDEAERARLARFGTRWRLLRLLEGQMSEAWFDDLATPERESREQIVARALEQAWREGVARWGEEVARWPYAEIHTLTLEHALGGLPLVGGWFERGPFPVHGSATTVDALGGPWRGDAVSVAYGPSMRFVTDAADPAATFAIVPGGQAGHPADPHYDDQLGLYFAGGARPVPWGEAAQERGAVSRLRLVPRGGG